MANPVGRYVQIAVNTPENVQSFTLVKETSTSNFNNMSKSVRTHSGTGCKTIELYPTSERITDEDRAVLDGLGYIRHQKEQYSIITNGSTYRTMMTANESGLATNRNFEPVEVGVKPIDFDDNKTWKYYTKHDCNDHSSYPELFYYRNVRANATWNAETQYYQNTTDFHHYYVIDGEKKVRFGVGDLGLYYNKNMSQLIAATNDSDGDSRHSAFWTFIDGDTTTSLWSGIGSTGYNIDIGNTILPGVQNLFSGMTRYLFDSETYNSHWKTGVTDEQKGQWRTRVHNDLVIKNVTITQFGFVNHDGHRYFGIWAFYPETKYYVGYNQYPVENNKGTGPYTAQTVESDLRTYDFSKPIPDTEVPRLRYYRFFGVELDALNVTLEEKEGIMPPDVNPNPPGGANWPGADKDTFPLKGRRSRLLSYINKGFKIYRMPNYSITEDEQTITGNDFGEFSALIWNWANFGNILVRKLDAGLPLIGETSMVWEAFKDTFQQGRIDPLNAVAFANIYPRFMAQTLEFMIPVNEITLGGYTIYPSDMGLTSLNTQLVGKDVYYWGQTIDCSGFNTNQGYLELAPYSQAEIYLPYIGFVQLDPQDFFGGSIEVHYNCSVFDGALSAQIICIPGLAPGNPVFYGPFVGSACQVVPLSQRDANAFQRTMGVLTAGAQAAGGVMKSLTSTMGNFMTGGLNSPHSVLNQGWNNVEAMGAGTAKAAGTLIDTMLMPQRLNHGASLPTGSGFVTNNGYIHIFVTTPVPKYLNKDEVSKYGNASGEIKTVRDAKEAGKTVYCKFKYIDTHNIEATAAEIEAINRYLTGGVYL